MLANTVHVDPPALSNFTGKYNPTSLKNTVDPGILQSLGTTVHLIIKYCVPLHYGEVAMEK